MAVQVLRLGLRITQLVVSLIALATIAGAPRGITLITLTTLNLDASEISMLVSSHGTTFAILMTYTAMFYALWNVVAVEIYGYASRPSPLVDRAVDGFFAVVLLITGIVLAVSDFTKHCDVINSPFNEGDGPFRCGSLKAGVAFTFIAMASFLVTFGLNFFGASHISTTTTSLEVATEYTAEAEYHGESTPKDALSPIGGTTKTPEAHV